MKLNLNIKMFIITLCLSLFQLNCHTGDIGESDLSADEPCPTDGNTVSNTDAPSNTAPDADVPNQNPDSDNPDSTVDSEDDNSPTDEYTPNEDGDESSSEGAPGDSVPDEPEPEEPDFLPLPNADFGEAGGFEPVATYNTGPGGRFHLYYPTPLGDNGIKHPIITWGNGTSAVPTYYNGLLMHLASHGFIVIASRSTNTGSGVQMLEGVDWVIEENDDPESILFDVVRTNRIGATGHSQGGGGTVNAANDPRVTCSVPIQPTAGQVGGVQGPMLVVAGGLDTVISPTYAKSATYNPAQVPSIWGNLLGANHFTPLGYAGDYRWVVTAWFRHHLYGDPDAEPVFFGNACMICEDDAWDVERKNW